MSYFFTFVINPSHDIVKKNPLLPILAEQLSQDYAQQTVTETRLKTIGTLLWQSLQIDEQFEQLYQKYHSLALVIQHQNQQIHHLPWECLYHPRLGFLAKQSNFTISRCLSNQKIEKKFTASTPIQMLLFSLPHTDLQFELEQYEIYQVLHEFIVQGIVQLSICDDGDFAHFQALLQAQAWHFVLLSGHHLITTDTKKSFFIFENAQKVKEAVAVVDIVPLFQHTECVILLACQTAQLSLTHSFAWQLAQMGIPNVIGMREAILDRAALIFIKHFCICLFQQKRIDIAVQYGRQKMTHLLMNNEIWSNSSAHHGQWCLPTLFTTNLTIIAIKIKQSPTFLKYNIPIFSVLIGRRKEVQHLLKIAELNCYSQLVITGVRGIGKTAFADQVINRLYLKEYNIFACRANSVDELITHLLIWLKITDFTPDQLEIALTKLKTQKWIVWLDEVNSTQYRAIEPFLTQVTRFPNLHILITSSERLIISTNCYCYLLTEIAFEDFVRYIRYIGLPYQIVQIRLLYKLLAGNFKAIQLLQTMPIQTVNKKFMQQLLSIKRYLQAYLR